MSRLRARSSCEIVRHPLLCNQLIHRCEQIPGADFATHGERRSIPAPPSNNKALCPPAAPQERETHSAQSSDLHPGDLLQLPGLAVNSRQQEPGRLAHVIAVHRETAPVPRVSHCHPNPLHQRRQHDEGPAEHTNISAKAHEQHHSHR